MSISKRGRPCCAMGSTPIEPIPNQPGARPLPREGGNRNRPADPYGHATTSAPSSMSTHATTARQPAPQPVPLAAARPSHEDKDSRRQGQTPRARPRLSGHGRRVPQTARRRPTSSTSSPNHPTDKGSRDLRSLTSENLRRTCRVRPATPRTIKVYQAGPIGVGHARTRRRV